MQTVDVLWTQVCDGWDDDKRHQAFIQYCRDNQLLGEAARRYREICDGPEGAAGDEEPAEGPPTPNRRQDAARKRLAAIAFIAMSTIDEHRSDGVHRSPRMILRVAAVVLFIAALIALALVLWAVYGHEPMIE